MTSPSLATLGRALRELRQQAGLTQEQVASHVGLDGAYVSRVERGARDLQFSTLARFLDALDASLADLERTMEQHQSSREK